MHQIKNTCAYRREQRQPLRTKSLLKMVERSQVQFASIQFSYRIYISRSYNTKLWRLRWRVVQLRKYGYISVFSRLENCPSVSDAVLISSAACSMLTDQRLKSFVNRSKLFFSAAQPGHPDQPSATVDVRLHTQEHNYNDIKVEVHDGDW